MVDINPDFPVVPAIGSPIYAGMNVPMESVDAEDKAPPAEKPPVEEPGFKETLQTLAKQAHKFVQTQPYLVLLGVAGGSYVLGRGLAARIYRDPIRG